jgi:gliding motility-associated-like protein
MRSQSYLPYLLCSLLCSLISGQLPAQSLNDWQKPVSSAQAEYYYQHSTNFQTTNDGTIAANPVKGTAPFAYSIDGVPFQSSTLFSALPAATCTVTTMKDAARFAATARAIVVFFSLAVTTVHTNVVCSNHNGTITATGSGGMPPYQYSLDGINFQAGNVFTGLGAGAYTVTIKDQLNAIATTTATITDSPRPGLQIDIVSPSCSRNDGVITLTAIGGTAPFEYSINNFDFFATNIFTGVTPGIYNAVVRDANGCQYMTLINSVTATCPELGIAITYERCSNANGALTIAASNGNPPYEYSLDGINFQTSNYFPGLVAGDYTVTVRDALGYTNSGGVTVEHTCPVVTAVATDAACGNATGSITVSGSGGLAPYQYSLDGVNFQTNTVFSGLAAGTYTVTIKDTWWTSINTTTVTIGDSPGPQLDASFTPSSCSGNDAVLMISGSNSTSPFQYSIDGINFQNAGTFSGLAPGDYTAIVKDATGCMASMPVDITLVNNLQLEAGSDLTICEGNSISIPATANGGNFTWTPSLALSNDLILTPTASPGQTTRYYVTSKLGMCTREDSVTINVNKAPIANAGSNTSICKGQDGHLQGSGGISYAWSPANYLSDPTASNPNVVNPPSSVTYQLHVTDANGCKSLIASSVTLHVTSDTKVFAGNDTTLVLGQPFKLSPQDSNNSGFVQYNWSPSYGLNDPSIKHPVAILDRDMTYVVTAVTAAGCSATDEIKVKVYRGPEIYVPTAFSPNNDGNNDILKAIPVGIKVFRYFVVYNRWGQRIFYTADPSRGWDGRVGGQAVATDTYVWMVEGIDDTGKKIQKKGTVTLVR